VNYIGRLEKIASLNEDIRYQPSDVSYQPSAKHLPKQIIAWK
jgi:hypothetical protein